MLLKERKSITDKLEEPTFEIFSNKVPYDILTTKPQRLDALKTIHGIGKKKLSRYLNNTLKCDISIFICDNLMSKKYGISSSSMFELNTYEPTLFICLMISLNSHY